MIKFLNILSNVISEQKRYRLSPEDYTKLLELTNRLWALRSREIPRKIEVDQMEFKTADGSDGKFKVFLNPRYKNYGQMDLKPRSSRNPQKFEMQLNPKLFGSKKNVSLKSGGPDIEYSVPVIVCSVTVGMCTYQIPLKVSVVPLLSLT